MKKILVYVRGAVVCLIVFLLSVILGTIVSALLYPLG